MPRSDTSRQRPAPPWMRALGWAVLTAGVLLALLVVIGTVQSVLSMLQAGERAEGWMIRQVAQAVFLSGLAAALIITGVAIKKPSPDLMVCVDRMSLQHARRSRFGWGLLAAGSVIGVMVILKAITAESPIQAELAVVGGAIAAATAAIGWILTRPEPIPVAMFASRLAQAKEHLEQLEPSTPKAQRRREVIEDAEKVLMLGQEELVYRTLQGPPDDGRRA
jgi:hypothetical protein